MLIVTQRPAMRMSTPSSIISARTSPALLTRTILSFVVMFVALLQIIAIGLSTAGVRLTHSRCSGLLVVAMLLAGTISRYAKPTHDGIVNNEIATREGITSFLPRSICWSLVFIFVLLVGVLALTGYIRGDVSYDGNAYHILPINQWALNGYIRDVDRNFEVSPFVNGYPKGAETVAFVCTQVFGTRSMGMLNVIYAPLGFFGLALLCQLFGATLRDSFLLSACYLVVPTNLYQYGSTYVDAAFAFSTIALLALLGFILVVDRKCGLLEALVVGCGIGNVLAIKATGPLIAIVSVGSFLVWSILSIRGLRNFGRWSAPLWLVSFSSVVAFAVGGFWYIKNYIHYGNPLYPVEVSVSGHTIWPGIPLATIFKDDVPPMLRAVHPLAQLVLSWLTPFLRLKPWYAQVELGSLGAFWVLACIPAIVACGYCLNRGIILTARQKVAYYFLAGSVLLFLIGTPLSFRSRLTVWLFALGMPSICIALGAAQQSSVALCRFLRYWVPTCISVLVCQAVIVVLIGGLTVAEFTHTGGRITFHLLRRGEPVLPLYPEMHSALLIDILNTASSIGVGPDGELGHARRIYGQLATPIGKHNLIPVLSSVTADDVNSLRSVAGLQYILWLSDRPVPQTLAQNVSAVGTDGPFTFLKLTTNVIPLARFAVTDATPPDNLGRKLVSRD